jgi:hypothetical protein
VVPLCQHRPRCVCSFVIPVATQVFAWGDGSSGRLGLGSEHDALVPTRIDTFAPNTMLDIAKVGCRVLHNGQPAPALGRARSAPVNVNVNVNELRLGFSNTTRNPEGILSHNNRKS